MCVCVCVCERDHLHCEILFILSVNCGRYYLHLNVLQCFTKQYIITYSLYDSLHSKQMLSYSVLTCVYS